MRNIVQQAPLRGDELLQLQRHAVEVAPEVRDFVAPAAHQRGDARLEPAGGRRVERPAQVADRAREVPGEERAEGEAGGDADDDELPGRDRRWTGARRRTRPRRARHKEQIVVAAGGRDAACALPVGPALDELARGGERGRRHLAAEDVVSLPVYREDHRRAACVHFLQPGAQRFDAAVAQRRGRHVGGDARGRSAGKLGRPGFAPVLQPDGGAGDGGGAHQREPEADEDFPEEPAHRYSLARW